MKNNLKRIVILFLAMTICFGTITGCSGRLTPKKLMKNITKNLKLIKSVSNSMNMNVELEDVFDTTRITMDMLMENTVDPQAGHASGAAHVKMNETEVGSDIEIYQVNEDGAFVTYSSMYGQWSRESAENSKKSTFNGNLFEEAGESIESFRLAEQNVTVEEQECYEMYGDISGKELLGFMGLEMMGAFGLVEIPDPDAIMKLQIPVIIDVYKEEMLPARVIVDMTDVMNELYDEYGKSTNVNDFTIKLGYTGFDQVEKIEVPTEVLQATGQ